MTYLEHVEYDVEFDGLLAANRVVHTACIGKIVESDTGSNNEGCFNQVALVRDGKPDPVS
jgi:hypothetical protein